MLHDYMIIIIKYNIFSHYHLCRGQERCQQGAEHGLVV